MSDNDRAPGRNDNGEAFDGGRNRADPEQVARRLHEERRFLGSGEPDWDDLADDLRRLGIALIVALVEWLEFEGSDL